MSSVYEVRAQIGRLMPKAESGAQWAEICRLEAVAVALEAGAGVCDACNGDGEREVTIGGDGYGGRCAGLADVPMICSICDGRGYL